MPKYSIQQLRRRPPGDKALIYLDQSTVSALALETEAEGLRDFLIDGLEAGRLICPRSLEHQSESALLDRDRWEKVTSMSNRLSDGIWFNAEPEIQWTGIHAAAASFSGEAAPQELWEEAFATDPHTPRDDLYTEVFGGRVRITAKIPPDELQRAEVERIKEIEDIADDDYKQIRGEGLNFAEAEDRFFRQLIHRELGPLVDPQQFQTELGERTQKASDAIAEGDTVIIARSPISRLLTAQLLENQNRALVRRYPKVGVELEGFLESGELAGVPSLRYQSLLRAAIVTSPGKKARPGDGFDIDHLIRGLSRCDVVTADRAMEHLSDQHGLAPEGCSVRKTADYAGIQTAISGILGG